MLIRVFLRQLKPFKNIIINLILPETIEQHILGTNAGKQLY